MSAHPIHRNVIGPRGLARPFRARGAARGTLALRASAVRGRLTRIKAGLAGFT
jgi:hypothetical protein